MAAPPPDAGAPKRLVRAAPEAMTVTALTEALKRALERDFRQVRVQGELVDVRPTQAGHVYFTLRDAGAQLPCVLWRSVAERLPLRLAAGQHVVLGGELQIYAPHGRYQLIVQRVAERGQGDRLQELEALRVRLQAEGLFDASRKKQLPFLPRRIGVVTAATGAAIHDILTTLGRRYPADILLSPARVQGADAPLDLVRALVAVARVPGVDVVIIARGGGSLEDLFAFNDERVVRAVAACPVPTVSAIGHESDWVLTDLAADQRAATPTAGAQLVVPRMADLRAALADLEARAHLAVVRRTGDARHGVERRTHALERALRVRLQRQRARLAELETRLRRVHPAAQLARLRLRVTRAETRLEQAALRLVGARRHALVVQTQRLELLSPTASLARGYAIVRTMGGAVVRRPSDVQPDERLEVRVAEGVLYVRRVDED